MKIRCMGVISFGCLCLIIVITQGDSAESKALSSKQSSDEHIIRTKRNAWWSKKSVGDTGQKDGLWDRNSLYDMGLIPSATKSELQSRSDSNMRQPLECYTNNCVPDFVWCGRQADNKSDFYQCKLQHRMCAATCFAAQKKPLLTGLIE